MVTTRELAIAASVIHASLEEYPLTLEELHESLIGSLQTRRNRLGVRGQRGCSRSSSGVTAFLPGRPERPGRRAAAARSPQPRLPRSSRALLRLVCCLPFVRLVALSGRIARLNLRPAAIWISSS
jgi:hypothetical protein